MEVKIGAEYWKHLEDNLKRFAVAMANFEKRHELLIVQALVVETMGSDAEIERANKLAKKLGSTVKFSRREQFNASESG